MTTVCREQWYGGTKLCIQNSVIRNTITAFTLQSASGEPVEIRRNPAVYDNTSNVILLCVLRVANMHF